MFQSANYQVIEGYLNQLGEEYNIDERLRRYTTTNPELLELAINEGISKDLAPMPLFIADFVITSSEVEAGISDSERRRDIVRAFKKAIEKRSENSEGILKVFYLSQKVAVALRRNRSFLAGRGLDEKSSKILLIDLYISPYAEVVRNIIGEGNASWELGLLNSAVKGVLPDQEITKFLANSYSPTSAMWEVVNSFFIHHKAEINDTVVLPYMNETKAIVVSSGKKPYVSTHNCGTISEEEQANTLSDLLKYFEASDKDKQVLYVRGTVLGTDERLILVRYPQGKTKPIAIFHTPADEVNVTEMLKILKLRDEEDRDVLADSLNVSEQVRVLEDQPPEKMEIEVEEKQGFFSKLFRRGRKKKKVTKSVKRGPKEVVKVNRKVIANLLPAEFAKELVVTGFSDLRLFEEWDTIRENEYIIVGALESNFKNKDTSIVTEERMGNPNDISDILDGIDEVMEKVATNIFGLKIQLVPNEIVYSDSEGRTFIIAMDGDETRIVGTIAVTYEKDVTKWKDDSETPVKRRTLHMRTNQLMSSLSHTPFDRSVERIYGEAISKESKMISLGRAILPLTE